MSGLEANNDKKMTERMMKEQKVSENAKSKIKTKTDVKTKVTKNMTDER